MPRFAKSTREGGDNLAQALAANWLPAAEAGTGESTASAEPIAASGFARELTG